MPITKTPDSPCAASITYPRLPTWLTEALRRQAEQGCPSSSARPPHQTAALLYEALEQTASHTHPPKR